MALTKIETNWAPSLEIGEEAQRQFATILIKHGFTVKPYKDGKQKEADLIIQREGGPELLVEVKKDVLADQTGNFAIECRWRGQPSGISTTQAHIFAIGTKEKFYCFKTSELKEWIKANWKHLTKKPGGDQNEAHLVIIPQKLIRSMAKWVLTDENSYGDW